MTAFDYVVIAVLALSALLGWMRGVVGEILALVSWVIAFVVAGMASLAVAPWLPASLNGADLRIVVAWALTFVAVLLLVAIVRSLLKALLKAAGLGGLDRLMGAGFGVLRGVVVVLVLAIAGGLTPLPASAWWRTASLSLPVETAAIAVKPWLPQALAMRLKYR